MGQGSSRRSFSWSRAGRVVLSVSVVGLIFFYFLPRIVSYDDVVAAVTALTWMELLSLVALGLWNQATYAVLEVAGRPGLNYWQAFKITLTSTAIANTLPAGSALGVGVQTGMYSSYGFSMRETATSLMVTGVWNTFVKLAMPLVALVLLMLDGSSGGGSVALSIFGMTTLAAAVSLFWVALKSARGARAVGRTSQRLATPFFRLRRTTRSRDWGEALVNFRNGAVDLLRERWKRVTAAALISHVTLYLLLLLSLRHMGVANSEVTWQEVLAAFAFVRLISAIPITPGGVGVVELGTTAALVAAGGDRAPVVAAVLLYRLLTFVLPIPLGGVAYVFWRKGAAARSLRRETPVTARVG